ncbi:3-(3-hydroxyphenyl)propionate hydroxylase [Sphingobium amiense]|uniref:3-(3-hydroxyphenyl)propionate hydroxylase n=1 Tax=Sphingobium amiense TaxID=135719 RepID=A0A494W5U6_9SPHN|nr:bifunctional 3-(3-hydroxy-phenyl)propionate/3-hydroxycinnamic acid hydroxylase [Sphingobium amiense]BBD99954.1 3-(3-hydroxyphenyl)propionate hydroxylase [Sphingobium amiense]
MLDTGQKFDVIVIGFGPSGATLAHLLGLSGLSVLVLERDGGIYNVPRAVHFDDEVMRVFQTIGVADAVAEEARVNVGMRFVDPDGNLLLDWSRPQDIGQHGWHASYRFHQPTLEAVLNEGIAKYPNVHLRRRCEAFLVEDRGDEALVRYEDMATGRIMEARCAHVVGCDGARSLLRRFIGSGMEDHGFHEKWLVVDVLLNGERPDLGDHSVQYCHPERSMTYARQPGNRRRWEIRLLPGEQDYSIARPDQIWALLSRWIGPDEAEIERVAAYTFHSLVAERWRDGRLWIAGDAAHQTPPFMGQGMCAGIRDVANLAWKLVRSVRGEASEELLDSYQSERKPNVTRYIVTAVGLGGLINASDPGAALRMAQSSGESGGRMKSLVSELGPGPGAGPHRGRIFAQSRLRDGRRMDDAVGYAMALVADAELAREIGPVAGLQVITPQDAPGIGEELSRLGVRAALVRPDRYILATATSGPELTALLATPAIAALLAPPPSHAAAPEPRRVAAGAHRAI